MVTIGQLFYIVTLCDHVVTVKITDNKPSITINGNGQELSFDYVCSTGNNGEA